MHVTGKDIAKKLGLSPSTVSQALNNKGSLKPETVALIQRTAREMGYDRPDGAAAHDSLQGKALPIILSGTSRHGQRANLSGMDVRVLRSIEDALEGTGAQSMVVSELQMEQLLRPDALGALIVGGYASQETLSFLAAHSISAVMIGSPTTSPTINSVLVDVVGGLRSAVLHLHELGHKEIALLNGPEETLASDLKLTGYLRGLFDCGIGVRRDLIRGLKRNVETSREALLRLLPNDWSDVTAIICAYEEIAIAVAQAAQQLDLHLPDDLSIVSYHDEGMAEFAVPPITTVALAPERLGRLAVSQLLALKRDPDMSGTQLLIPAQLKIRASTAAVRSSKRP